MKKTSIFLFSTLFLAACGPSAEMFKVQSTPYGEEPEKAERSYPYVLPQTVLKVEVALQELISIPGPYWEYAEKYLGLTDVVKKKESHWQVYDVEVSAHQEMDPRQFYSLNVLSGPFHRSLLQPFLEQGMLMEGHEGVHAYLKGEQLQSIHRQDFIRYEEARISDNFEERTETMYKTIVTDTSFVEVPVQRTVVEQKSISTKAREAANFLLELRTRRFETLTGEYEVFPDGEAMGASIRKLDQMESAYLSLFRGKTVSRIITYSWFLVPEQGSDPSIYPLAVFAPQLGFVPAELGYGEALEVHMHPLGHTHKASAYVPYQAPENTIHYRVPDVAELKIMMGDQELATHRISIFQSGSLIFAPIE